MALGILLRDNDIIERVIIRKENLAAETPTVAVIKRRSRDAELVKYITQATEKGCMFRGATS